MKKITGPFFGLIVTASLILAQTAPLPDSPWHFMDTQRIGAYDLLKSHPTFDGRGVIIIICDSGVDMGVQGLLLTSEGKTKVLDAQDFSGQGDIKLQKAKLDSTGYKPALKTESILLYDFDLLPHQPADSIYWVGCLDEKKYFQNAGPKDINNNGKEDDKFGVVTFPISINDEERWVYFVDENGDGSLLDEKPRFDYNINFDTFSFTGRDAQKEKKLYTFALNIRAEKKIASFHACDNSHGTHCAGIAAGFQLFGEETLHGIAPGAQVISAKIGDGTLSGGATTTGSMKKAYEYGVKYAKDHNVPVVFSMSYGVDSGIEGRSDIEAFLNKIMQENEQVVIVTSNGNSGPGLSSAGNPSCASRILSVGALLPLGIARDSYGFANDRDRLMHFTSRGGECGKPGHLHGLPAGGRSGRRVDQRLRAGKHSLERCAYQTRAEKRRRAAPRLYGARPGMWRGQHTAGVGDHENLCQTARGTETARLQDRDLLPTIQGRQGRKRVLAGRRLFSHGSKARI